MKIKSFNLEEYLADPSKKVVTRDGKNVIIINHILKNNKHKVPYIIVEKDGSEDMFMCTDDGICFIGEESPWDIFFLEESEPELTEFKEALKQFLYEGYDSILDITHGDAIDKWKDKLLELAKKELQPEIDADLDKAYKTQDAVVYENGKRDALKNVPKWRKSCNFCEHDGSYMQENFFDGDIWLCRKGYKISINELISKLPKEE